LQFGRHGGLAAVENMGVGLTVNSNCEASNTVDVITSGVAREVLSRHRFV